MSDWRPIETAPEGEHILLWFPKGERGRGGIETATIVRGETDTRGSLLRRYMQRIVTCESVSYVGEAKELRPLFSEEEIKVLQRLSREIGAADAPPE